MTGSTEYIHAADLDARGEVLRRPIFADISADGPEGMPDAMKVAGCGIIADGRPQRRMRTWRWSMAPTGTTGGVTGGSSGSPAAALVSASMKSPRTCSMSGR